MYTLFNNLQNYIHVVWPSLLSSCSLHLGLFITGIIVIKFGKNFFSERQIMTFFPHVLVEGAATSMAPSTSAIRR